jgi:hypothetical protein
MQHGNIYITGYFSTMGSGKNAVLLVYDINGNLIYTDEYAGSYFGDDIFALLMLMHSVISMLLALLPQLPGNNDYITIKYAMPGISSLAGKR